MDEFGRKRAPPPRFETHGTKYTLDPRSGSFYSGRCGGWYYHPTQQLYYSRGSSTYGKYDERGRWTLVPAPTTIEPEPPALLQPSTIAIQLKTKSFRKKKKEASVKQTAEKPASEKQPHSKTQAQIQKWSQPICWLCRRKFASLAKLAYHEEHSAMHRTNLEQQQQPYQDRAQQRRMWHGEQVVRPVAPPTTTSTFPDPPDLSVGRGMLEKMGWKKGDVGEGAKAIQREWDRSEGKSG